MNKTFTGLLMAVTLSAVMGSIILAQPPDHPGEAKIMTFEKSSVQIIDELGAIIVWEDSNLMVQMVAPAKDRPVEYRAVDLQIKDQILMLNGKKIETIQDLDEGYQKIDIGKDVQLAIKRGNDRMIVSFPKADPEKQTNSRILIMRTESDLPIDQLKEAEPGIKTITIDDIAGEIYPVLGAGIIVIEDGSNVKIKELLPNATGIYGDVMVLEGDIIKSLQKKDITSVAQFSDNFKQIPVGDDVDLLILRDNELIEVSFDKKEPPMIMKKSDEN
jgi:S1-C subfamily serine protease